MQLRVALHAVGRGPQLLMGAMIWKLSRPLHHIFWLREMVAVLQLRDNCIGSARRSDLAIVLGCRAPDRTPACWANEPERS